jgi:hypothetical protein
LIKAPKRGKTSFTFRARESPRDWNSKIMLKTILMLPLLLLFSNGADHSVSRFKQQSPESQTGTLEKMIVANGSVAMDIDLNRLNGTRSPSRMSTSRFAITPNSFFTILVFNNELRGPLPSSMELIAQNAVTLPAPLGASYHQLVLESTSWGADFELVVRDEKTGFVFFNIEGHTYDYDANEHLLSINEGRLLVSKEFAAKLGRPSEEGSVVGRISVTATMRAIEITRVDGGEVKSDIMPANGTVPGPDVIVGDLNGLSQPDTAAAGTQVGISVGTDSCNNGQVDLDWFQTPNNDHPVIPQNLYRMSGGATNDERFEQIGQSNVKHAFTALMDNICGFGCNGVGGTHLGSGCSDPYVVSLNSGGSSHNLGSRAWINPFTGAFPRGDSATPPNSHTGHSHNSVSHRMLVEINDLNTTLNPGATYYAEAQYITPHEYVWCQAHPGQCNMYNNVSYRRYNVSGTTGPFTFPTGGFTTVRTRAAITAWTGATINQFEPDPGNDGIGFVAYKVTNPSAGVWHYEYAVYNENLDRSIQSFSVPLGPGITVTNIGFHAPPQQPGWANDGTVGSAGYSSTPWTPAQTSDSLTWNSETFAQNPNANAIRWGTLYNFRFDSNRPPQTTNATIGFFKTGAPMSAPIQGPGPDASPTIASADVSVLEGNSGTTGATFAVTLSTSSTQTVTVQYATANGTTNPATGGASCGGSVDYESKSGTLTFQPGETSKPIVIQVCGDAHYEPNETFFVNLSNATNATLGDNQGLGTIQNDDTPATLEFTQVNFNYDESVATATLMVKRTGDPSGAVSVDFKTNDDFNFIGCGVISGKANQRCDYLLTSDTLSFAPNDLQKPIGIIIFNDVYVEGNESFSLTLSNPTGDAVLGALSTSVVMIVDNDSGTATTNPIDGTRYFVRQQYFDFLQRLPEPGGEDYWTSQIDGMCSPGDAECISRRRTEVSKAFFQSLEFSGSGGFVYRLYKAAFGEETLYRPSYEQFMPDRARVIGGATLEQGKLDFANLFVQRSEFTSRYQTSLTPTQFVDAILQTVQQGAGVTFTPSERQSFIDDVNTGGRGQMMKNLGDNAAFTQAVFNRAFVLMQYFGYLRRDSEPGGYEFWLDRLNTTNNSNGMVCSFVNSGEYEQRFSPVDTPSGIPCP